VQEFNIEKLQLLESEKSKIRKEYERREAQVEVKKKMCAPRATRRGRPPAGLFMGRPCLCRRAARGQSAAAQGPRLDWCRCWRQDWQRARSCSARPAIALGRRPAQESQSMPCSATGAEQPGYC